MNYRHGIDNIDEYEHLLNGKRLGLITNYTGVDLKLRRTADVLFSRFKLVKLFAPEHGLYGVKQAGASVNDETDAKTGLPVVSLYGGSGATGAFSEIDAVLFDIQDVGLRFYTYISVLAISMKECARTGIPMIVLDRLNPLGLGITGGTLLDEKFSSFVGMYELPSRHGMTVGEYAQYINREREINCELYVVKCSGLKSGFGFPDSGLPWIFPSPNIPTYETAVVYAATVLLEGTNVSEGRGTTKPFQLIGAPWIDGEDLSSKLNAHGFPGVTTRPAAFSPLASKYAGDVVNGVEIILTDARAFDPFGFGLTLLDILRRDCKEFEARDGLKLILGTDAFFSDDFNVKAFLEKEAEKIEKFNKKTEKYRIYG